MTQLNPILFQIATAIILGVTSAGLASQAQDQSRALKINKIEAGRAPSANPSTPDGPRTYRSTSSKATANEIQRGSASEAVVGVTLWRLRPSRGADAAGARILEHGPAKDAEWAAERVEAATPIKERDRLRISIEYPGQGYLYVVDREQHADGSLGDAYLIFPTKRTRGGDNSLSGGRIIEFPGQDDNPPYFTLTRSSAEHVGELLTVIVSSRPLPDLVIGAEPLQIPSGLLSKWEKEWSAKAEQFELEGGAGRPYTKEEKLAGAEGSRMLKQGDPLPQTVFRVEAKSSNQPVLVKLLLRIAK